MAYTWASIGIVVMFSLAILGLGIAIIYNQRGKRRSTGTDTESASTLVPFDISKHSSYRHDHSQLDDHQAQINVWIAENNLNSSDVYIGSTAFANEATRTLHFTHYAYMHIDHITAHGAIGHALPLIRISTVERPDLVEWHPAGVPRTTDIPRSAAAAATASSAVRMGGGGSAATSVSLPSRPRSARLRQPSPADTEDQFELQGLSDRLPASSSSTTTRSVRR